MEQGLYIFFYCISFIFFLLMIFKDDDYQLQGLFAAFSFILFLILTILSFNIELIIYDGTLGFTTRNMANFTLEAMFPILFSFALSIFSFLFGFIIFTQRAWNKAIIQKPMKFGDNGFKL